MTRIICNLHGEVPWLVFGGSSWREKQSKKIILPIAFFERVCYAFHVRNSYTPHFGPARGLFLYRESKWKWGSKKENRVMARSIYC